MAKDKNVGGVGLSAHGCAVISVSLSALLKEKAMKNNAQVFRFSWQLRSWRQLGSVVLFVFLLGIVCGGFGYFGGRMEQIELTKAALKIIPDTNCGIKSVEE
jgi:hypothetical protein